MQPENQVKPVRLWLIAAGILSGISYYFLIYHTSRTEFSPILVHYLVLAVLYLIVIRTINGTLIYWAIAMAIAFRMLLIVAIPELSDDFYRFIWDGRLLAIGISPFAELPSTLMTDPLFASSSINQQLFTNMNSPDYFTVYPPLAQMVFYLAAKIAPENILANVVIMRSIIILFEAGSLWVIYKILQAYKLPKRRILIYAWNPLVIIELTGNLHFEALMIFFLLLGIYGFQLNRWKFSAIALSASIASKLIPLLFLPLFINRLDWKKLFGYWIVSGIATLLFFLAVWDPELIRGMGSSLSLYFQNFEFNASIYYLIREIGFAVKGYNIIEQAGQVLAITTLVVILWFAVYSGKRLRLPIAMLLALTIYLLMSTIVHPWYITPLVALSVFSGYRYPQVWSILVIVSYAGYSETGYTENMLLVVVEYVLLLLVILWDFRQSQPISQLSPAIHELNK